jgi:hypothetical protein
MTSFYKKVQTKHKQEYVAFVSYKVLQLDIHGWYFWLNLEFYAVCIYDYATCLGFTPNMNNDFFLQESTSYNLQTKN